MKEVFLATLKFLVNGMCIAFVIWQTIQCMTKYVRKPKGTIVTMEKSSEVPFPAITVCGSFGKDTYAGILRFNKNHLENVCGIR